MDDYNDSFEQTSSFSSNSGNAEAGNLETAQSSTLETLNSSESQTLVAPVPEFVNSTNDARIEATTSDVVQEITQYSLLTQGSTLSSMDSLRNYGSIEQRRRAAMNAVDHPKFQFLSNFKAFDSASPSPMDTPLIDDGLAFTPENLGKEVSLMELKHTSVTKPSVTQSLPRGDQKPRFTKKDSTPQEDSSSVFSTLSQHLKTTKQSLKTAEVVSRAASVPHEASPPTQDVEPAIQYDPPYSNSVVHLAVIEPSMPDIKPALPVRPSPSNLPLSSLNMKSAAEASLRPLSPSLATLTGNMLITSSAPEAVPPRPPSRIVQLSPEVQTFAMDPKLLELRETSEAVERLVKAFALLRGQFGEHGLSDHAAHLPSFQTSAKETLASTTYHRVCGDATVRPNTTRVPAQSPYVMASPPSAQHPPPPTLSLSKDEIAALKANEAKVEEALMVCVLEMLKQELANPQRVKRLVDSLKARPPHETITADEFKVNSVSFGGKTTVAAADWINGARHHDIYSVLDSDMRAFDSGDEDAASTLFNSVQDGIHKYVFHHVVNPMATRPPTTKSQTASPITPYFSWILLLDLLAVCEDIMAVGFARGGTAISGPLLVRYDGDASCEFIARNAIQCLPFEALEVVGGSERHKPVFRLEFWVTKDKMRVIIAAVTDCVRQHIVHEARVQPYMGLLENNLEIHPAVLVPSKGPLFSFIQPNSLGNATRETAKDDAMSYGKGGSSYKEYIQRRSSLRHINGIADDENMFGLDRKALQKVAYAVSVLSTDVLASLTSSELKKTHGASPPHRDTNDYKDLLELVAETVHELLEDIAIKASIERRVRDKFVKIQKKKKEYLSKDSIENEKKVIERAEKEAEDMVKRIVQQMALKASEA